MPFTSLQVDSSQIQEPSPSASTVSPQPEVTAINRIKPHSSTIRLDPLNSSTLRMDPLNTCTLRLDPHSSSMLHPDPACTSLPNVGSSSLNSSSCLNSLSPRTQNLDALYLYQGPAGLSRPSPEVQNSREVLSQPKPFTSPSACDSSVELMSRPSVASLDTIPKFEDTLNHHNDNPVVVPLPDPPPNSCLKSGTPVNHKDTRSNSRVGLRVHFKLPEDEEEEQSDASCQSEGDATQMSVNKEPPPVRAKPKL